MRYGIVRTQSQGPRSFHLFFHFHHYSSISFKKKRPPSNVDQRDQPTSRRVPACIIKMTIYVAARKVPISTVISLIKVLLSTPTLLINC